MVSQRFHKWIYVFEKKVNERMPMKKLWDYMIEVKEREDVSAVEGGKRRGVQVHQRTIEKRVYQTLEIILNNTSIFCRK